MRKFTFILAFAMSLFTLQSAMAGTKVVPIDDLQNKLYSNAPCTNTQWGDQFEGHWEYLFDNNTETIFHSEYGSKTSVDGLEHYIRVDMGEAKTVESFIFSFKTRFKNCEVNSPTEIVVEGSNVADGEYEQIAVLTGLPTTNSTDYTSGVLTNGNAYRFIRYRVTKTLTMQTDGGGKVFFFISEFGMSEVVEEPGAVYFPIYHITAKDANRGALYASASEGYLSHCGPSEGYANSYGYKHKDIAKNTADPAQQFVVVEYEDKKYLYSVGAQRFTNDEGKYVKLTENPEQHITVAEDGNYKVILFAGNDRLNFSGGWNYGVVADYNTADDGNSLVLTEVGSFNATELLAAMDEYFHPAEEELTEEKRAEAAAFFDAYAGKVGYPVQSVIDTYKETIAAAITTSEVEAAKQVVYASTDVNLPVAGKAYTLTVVAKNGNKYYLNYDGSKIALVERAANTELPLTALYACGTREDGVTLTTIDGNHLVYLSKSQTFGDVVNGNTRGFQDGVDDMIKINFEKIVNGGNVAASSNEQLFGLLAWKGLRGYKADDSELIGYVVIKTSDVTYDGADTPYFNAEFSSALLLEEYNSQPTVGGFYNIRSANTVRNYVNTTALIYTDANNSLKWANGYNGEQTNAVWTIEKDGDNYYAKNVHTNNHLDGVGVSETGKSAVALTLLGDGQFAIRAPYMLHAQEVDNVIYGYDILLEDGVSNKSNASAWYIDEVESFGYTLSVSAAEWSTVILGYNAVIPENVTCYAVSSINGDWATLSEVEGILPANTAVFVNAAQGNYTFTYTATAAEATSMLAGTLYNKNVEPAANARIYVLSNVNGVVGLYPAKVKEDGTVFNNANKAYLEIVSASKAIEFNFDGTTGIEEVENAAAETVIYDLTGRRVQHINAAGIYIVNGKQMLVK